VYRVICANLAPDHSTIAEFRKRHETALADLFTSVLRLCRNAGLVEVGVIAIDGTKISANASMDANSSYERIAREILAEAEATDEAEDELYGDARGDELPEQLRTREGRRQAFREAKRKLDAARDAAGGDEEASNVSDPVVALDLDRERLVNSEQGRRGWLRDGRHQLDERREQQARPVARSRSERLRESARRLEEEHQAEREANTAYETYRATARDRRGRRLSRPPDPWRPPETPVGTITRPIMIRGSFAPPASLPDRVTTRRQRSTRTRSSSPLRSRSTRLTSVTSNRWSTLPSGSLKPRVSPSCRRRWLQILVTGTSSRWRTLSAAGCGC